MGIAKVKCRVSPFTETETETVAGLPGDKVGDPYDRRDVPDLHFKFKRIGMAARFGGAAAIGE